jgi:hypothetical protein
VDGLAVRRRSARRDHVLAQAEALPLIGISFRADGQYRCRLLMWRGQIDLMLVVDKPVLFDPPAFVAAVENALGRRAPNADWPKALRLARKAQDITWSEAEHHKP